jgi:hypothetical protein
MPKTTLRDVGGDVDDVARHVELLCFQEAQEDLHSWYEMRAK